MLAECAALLFFSTRSRGKYNNLYALKDEDMCVLDSMEMVCYARNQSVMQKHVLTELTRRSWWGTKEIPFRYNSPVRSAGLCHALVMSHSGPAANYSILSLYRSPSIGISYPTGSNFRGNIQF